MNLGAFDYIKKLFKINRVIQAVKDAREQRYTGLMTNAQENGC
tara:strand:- start:525 stop:653 length:129 start_codon:yes stop_codon:yes gene_type:complete